MATGIKAGHPPARDLEIYHEWVWEGARQADLAAQFGVSQGRVAQLCHRVLKWVDDFLPARAAGLDAGHRLHLAITLRWATLASHYEPVLRPLGGQNGWLNFCKQSEDAAAGLLTEAEAEQLPPDGLLVLAGQILVELEELRALAARGPFAEKLEGLLATSPSEPQAAQSPTVPMLADTEGASLGADGTAHAHAVSLLVES